MGEARKERTDPAISDSLFPALAILADTDDDIEAIVTRIQTLAMTLRAIADEGEGVVFEVVVKLGKGPVAALVDDLLRARKVEGLDATRRDSLMGRQLKKRSAYFCEILPGLQDGEEGGSGQGGRRRQSWCEGHDGQGREESARRDAMQSRPLFAVNLLESRPTSFSTFRQSRPNAFPKMSDYLTTYSRLIQVRLAHHNLIYRLSLSLTAQHRTPHRCQEGNKHPNALLVRLVCDGVLGQRNRLRKHGRREKQRTQHQAWNKWCQRSKRCRHFLAVRSIRAH